jgi:hypothetical protein
MHTKACSGCRWGSSRAINHVLPIHKRWAACMPVLWFEFIQLKPECGSKGFEVKVARTNGAAAQSIYTRWNLIRHAHVISSPQHSGLALHASGFCRSRRLRSLRAPPRVAHHKVPEAVRQRHLRPSMPHCCREHADAHTLCWPHAEGTPDQRAARRTDGHPAASRQMPAHRGGVPRCVRIQEAQ